MGGWWFQPDAVKVTWYQLTVVRKDVTRGLAENSQRESLSMAWTHALLSVSKQVCFSD